MKKASKISLAIITPIVSSMALPLITSCSNATYIDPQIQVGENVKKVRHTNISLYQSFRVTLADINVGYEEIDTEATKIKIGQSYVTYNSIDPKTIEVPAEAVKSTDITIFIQAKETCQDFRVNWSATAKQNHKFGFGAELVAFSNGTADKIVFEDFKLETLWGDPAKKQWRVVEKNDPRLNIYFKTHFKNYQNITQSFKANDGRVFTDNDLYIDSETGEYQSTRFQFGFKYTTNTFEKSLFDMTGINGTVNHHIEKIEFNPEVIPEGNKIKVNESFKFKPLFTPTCSPGNVRFKLEEVDPNNPTGSSFGGYTLDAGPNPGKVRIWIESRIEEISSDKIVIEIVAA